MPLGWGDPRTLPGRIEIDLGFRGDDGAVLAGTLILPPDAGPHPAVVFHFGSDRWTRMTWQAGGPVWWIQNGIAVFTYDKRGVGRSQGTCCPWRDPGYFPLLGGDVSAAARAVADRPEIRGDLAPSPARTTARRRASRPRRSRRGWTRQDPAASIPGHGSRP